MPYKRNKGTVSERNELSPAEYYSKWSKKDENPLKTGISATEFAKMAQNAKKWKKLAEKEAEKRRNEVFEAKYGMGKINRVSVYESNPCGEVVIGPGSPVPKDKPIPDPNQAFKKTKMPESGPQALDPATIDEMLDLLNDTDEWFGYDDMDLPDDE